MPSSLRKAADSRSAIAARQMLLVRAALLDDERAAAAWHTWAADASAATLEPGEIRLLAVAFRRMTELAVDGPMVEVARGVYRRTWYMNQLALARNAEIIDRLRRVGIPSLVIKGFALAVLNYRDLGSRPMEDLDLVVGPDHVDAAVAALEPMGFRPLRGPDPLSGLLAIEREMADAHGNVVDLHAYAGLLSVDDSDLWEHRETFDVHGIDVLTPAAPDSLLLICAHAMLWQSLYPVSWLVDAVKLVRSSAGSFDWDRFVERSIAHRLTPVAARAVPVLRNLGLEIPDEVSGQIERAPVNWRDRIADRVARGEQTRLSLATMAWARYRRFLELAPPERRPAGFTDWLLKRWRLERRGQLVSETGRRLLSMDRWVRSQQPSEPQVTRMGAELGPDQLLN